MRYATSTSSSSAAAWSARASAALAAADPHLARAAHRSRSKRIRPPHRLPARHRPARLRDVARFAAHPRGGRRMVADPAAASLSPYDDMIVWDAAGKPRGAGCDPFLGERDQRAESRAHRREPPRCSGRCTTAPPFRQRDHVAARRARGLDARAGDRAVISLGDGRTIERGAGRRLRRRSLARVASSPGIETARMELRSARVRDARAHRAFTCAHGVAALSRRRSDRVPAARRRSQLDRVDDAPRSTRSSSSTLSAEAASQEIEQALDGVLGRVEVAAAARALPAAPDACARSTARSASRSSAMRRIPSIRSPGRASISDFSTAPRSCEVLAQEVEHGGNVEALAELRVLRRYERWRKSENTDRARARSTA